MSFNDLSLSLLFISSLFFPHVNSLTFNISSFDQRSTSLIEQQGDAFIKDGKIKLTENAVGLPKANSTGRAIYKQEIVLWDEKTRELTDFTTHFSFIIKCLKSSFCGDGLTFFLAKHTETIPEGSGGGRLALYGSKTDFNNTENGFVAVEFDSFKNYFDPSADHLGIDIDSVVSVANVSLNSSIKDGRTGNAWVTYNSSTHNMSVFLTYVKNPIYKAKSTLSYNVDLRNVLPSRVAVGFSASTGLAAETHEIISWSFSSRLQRKTEDPNSHTVAESPKKAVSPAKTPEKAEAPGKPKSPEAAKSPEISEKAVSSLFFNISRFDQGSKSLIEHQGDAFINGGRIKLTKDSIASYSTGRALYKQQVILWDEKSGELTDFTTHFSFIIKCVNGNFCGDGFTFFLAKHTAKIPKRSEGGLLALIPPLTDFGGPDDGIVAVEFDTFKNSWDPSANHVGIDVNSIVSVANISLNSSISDGRTANAWINYNSSAKNLSVFLTYDKKPIYRGNSILSYNIDLKDVLPSQVAIGFSASTGLAAETHEIISWSFSSRLQGKTEDPNSHTVAESPKQAVSPVKTPEKAEAPEKPKSPEAAKTAEISESPDNTKRPENSANTKKSNVGLIVALAASIGAMLFI